MAGVDEMRAYLYYIVFDAMKSGKMWHGHTPNLWVRLVIHYTTTPLSYDA